MNRQMRTYFYAVLGGIGGLLGWQVSNMLGLSIVTNLYASEALVGALVGLCVGVCIGVTEGIMTLNLIQAAKSGIFSGLLGMLAGAVGLPLSEFFFQTVGAGYFGRALGWALFGMLIGLAEGVFGKSQIWKGMLGGFIGGAIGGILLEAVRTALRDPLAGKAFGLVLLGASVGFGGVAWSLLYQHQRTLSGAWLCHAIVDMGIMAIGFRLLSA